MNYERLDEPIIYRERGLERYEWNQNMMGNGMAKWEHMANPFSSTDYFVVNIDKM